jgi:hypothetical protein
MSEFKRDRSWTPDSQSVEGLFDGQQFTNVETPDVVSEDGRINVTGTIEIGVANIVFPETDVRVVLRGTGISTPVVERVGKVSGGGDTWSRNFSISARVDGEPGTVGRYTLELQSDPYVGSWKTRDSLTFQSEILSSGQYKRSQAVDYLPWAVGGVGAGLLYHSYSGRQGSRLTPAAGGALAGVAGREGFVQFGGVPDFPTVPVAATAALLLGAGYLASTGAELSRPALPTGRLPGV